MNDKTPLRPPIAEAQVQRVRDFLREAFRGYAHHDAFDFEGTAHVFVMELERMHCHTLIVPQETFEDIDFGSMLNEHLIETLRLAGPMRVTLTRQGPRY